MYGLLILRLLVRIQDPKFTPMQGLPEGILPIFPSSFAIQVPIPSMTSNRQKHISAGSYRVVQDLL